MMEKQWRLVLQFAVGLSLVGLLVALLFPFITPLLLGGILAILTYPLFRRDWGIRSQHLKAVLIIAFLWAFLFLPFNLSVYLSFQKLLDLVSSVQGTLFSEKDIQNFVRSTRVRQSLEWVASYFSPNPDWLTAQGLQLLKFVLGKASSSLALFLSQTPDLLLKFLLVLLSHFFFLVDGTALLAFINRLSPIAPEKSKQLYETFVQSCRAVILGLVLSALAQGMILMLAFYIAGVPNAALFGLLTMVISFVPLVGSTPVSLGGVIYLLYEKDPVMAIVMAVAGVLTALVDNLIRPALMKGGVNLHPFLALISVFGGIQLLGYSGVFLGPILAAVTVAFLKSWSYEGSIALKP